LSNAEYGGHEILKFGAEALKGLGDLADKTIGKIPGLGKLAAIAIDLGAHNMAGYMHMGDAALTGNSVGQAAKEWGADMAGTAVSSLAGLVDPTGIGAGAAGNAVTTTIENKTQSAQA